MWASFRSAQVIAAKIVSKSMPKKRVSYQLRKIFSGDRPDISPSRVPLKAKLAGSRSFHATLLWRRGPNTTLDQTSRMWASFRSAQVIGAKFCTKSQNAKRSVFQGQLRKVSGELTWPLTFHRGYLWKRNWLIKKLSRYVVVTKGVRLLRYRPGHHECGRHSGRNGASEVAAKFVSKSNAKGAFSGSTEENIFRWIDLTFHFIAVPLIWNWLIKKLSRYVVTKDPNTTDQDITNVGLLFRSAQVRSGEKFASKSAKKERVFRINWGVPLFQVNWPDISFHRGYLDSEIGWSRNFHATLWRPQYATDQDITECGPRSGRRKW
jgi:hypothetical protein